MIRINVAQLLKQLIGTSRKYQISEDVSDTDVSVNGDLKLLRTDRGILITGELRTAKQLTCSRCLDEFKYPLTLQINEEYFPKIDVISGAVLSVPEDSFTVDGDLEICLDDALRQYIVMATPMKPLCRVGCEGLCVQCGCNLNRTTCNCLSLPDLRWGELGKLAIAVNSREQKREV